MARAEGKKLFQDQETWTFLRSQCLPDLSQRRKLRAWVPECATGEGVYSLALALAELLGETFLTGLTIYATDSNDAAVVTTRAGIFSHAAFDHVPADCRQRYFVPREDGSFKICESVRSVVICGHQDLLEDPPLAQLDLLLCENFPAHIGTQKQEQIINAFYWALRPNGLLILSPETAARASKQRFVPVAQGQPIFAPHRNGKNNTAHLQWSIDRAIHKEGQRQERDALLTLAATQEELETSLEALRMSNEELETAGEELRERQRQLDEIVSYQRLVLSSLGLGLVVLDRSFCVTVWNHESEVLFGLTEAAVLGRDFLALDLGFCTSELAGPLDAIVNRRAFVENQYLESAEPHSRGVRCKVRLSSLVAPDGQVLGVTLLIEDLLLQSDAPAKRPAARRMQKGNRGGSPS